MVTLIKGFKKMSFYDRWQKSNIQYALSTRRVVVLSGPRQCGKTTLVKNMFSNDPIYRTLDDSISLASAIADPHGFVHHNSNLMIIDEIQRAPELLRAIKKEVDENNKPGRYLLTGSANIQSMPGVNESLAGRVRNIRLYPLSKGEIEGAENNFIEKAFNEKFSDETPDIVKYKNDYIKMSFIGGYPEVINLDARDRRRWHRDYIDSLMERDLMDIIKIQRKNNIHKLLEVLAAWSSKFMNVSEISSNLSISRPTLDAYINSLELLYLINRVRPWHKTDYDRVSRQDKLFMSDSGLMTSILNWRLDDVFLDGELNGKLIETFVCNQLLSILSSQEEDYNLYHYRDRLKREVDFIVERENGELLGIEVKSGSAVNRRSFRHLEWFRDNMSKNKKFIGIVLYSGDSVAPFGKGMWAVPIKFLWQ